MQAPREKRTLHWRSVPLSQSAPSLCVSSHCPPIAVFKRTRASFGYVSINFAQLLACLYLEGLAAFVGDTYDACSFSEHFWHAKVEVEG